MGWVKSVTRMWRASEGYWRLSLQKHLPGDAAIAEVAGGAGAQLGDVLGFGEVHFEEGADARGEREQIGGGLSGLRRGAGGDDLALAVSGFDGGAVVGEDAGLGEYVRSGGQVAGAGGFVAVLRGEALDDLRAAAMAVHVAEAADVHEDVEAQGGAGVEGAEGLVVLAAVAEAEVDDLGDARGGKPGDEVADLAVGVVAGGVEERGGELDFEGFGALDEIDERRGGGRLVVEELGGGLREIGLGLDEVVAGLGVFDEGGRGVDLAGEELGGLGGEGGSGFVA